MHRSNDPTPAGAPTRRPHGAAAAALILAASLSVPPAQAESTDALFAKYPAQIVYRGKPAAVDLASHREARNFRTRLRAAVREAQGPNFAGHMIVTTWGCGTSCQMVALIDARNGKVYFAPETATVGVAYRATSRLLVFNPPDNIRESYGDKPPDWAKTELYLWARGRLAKVK